jgi:hypothetical protein
MTARATARPPATRRGDAAGGSADPVRRSFRRGIAAGGAAVLVLLVVDEARVAEREAAEVERNEAQVAELVDLARATLDDLEPVVDGMAGALPLDGSPGVAADAATVAQWRSAVDGAAADFADPPSGATATNVARGGFRSAVDQLGSAVTAYELALTADPATRPGLERLAGELRTQAVAAWSVAATQLDVVAIDSGLGHTHVYLPAAPGTGAFGPDPAPEGSHP